MDEQYRIEQAATPSELARLCDSLMKQGYLPAGGVGIMKTPGGASPVAVFFQAMYLPPVVSYRHNTNDPMGIPAEL